MANPNDPADNLKWFYEHCTSHHYLLETAMPMLDVAVFILHYIKKIGYLICLQSSEGRLSKIYCQFHQDTMQ